VTILPPPHHDDPDVGEFDQGTLGSRWALGRYLVGRAIGEFVSRSLTVFALVVVALAGLVWWLGPHWLSVLIGVLAVTLFLLRSLLGAVLRRVGGAGYFGTAEDRMRRLVAETRGDIRIELRRIGVPSRIWTLPLLVWRLARRTRRAETLQRLRGFDPERVMPRSRLDELHMIVRQLRPPEYRSSGPRV
jgi:hypothetical protein